MPSTTLIGETQALGADAVVAVDLDCEGIGDFVPTVSANGTAVRFG